MPGSGRLVSGSTTSNTPAMPLTMPAKLSQRKLSMRNNSEKR